eukprot:scaffold254737_cov28-Tisochrysis_lutea.AAC.2
MFVFSSLGTRRERFIGRKTFPPTLALRAVDRTSATRARHHRMISSSNHCIERPFACHKRRLIPQLRTLRLERV